MGRPVLPEERANMGTEDRHDEDLFSPDPSREENSPGSEEPEEEFFVLEEEEAGEKEEAPGEEEGNRRVPGPPEEGKGDHHPSPDEPVLGEVDESLFEDPGPPEEADGPAGEPSLDFPSTEDGEVFVQEPPGAEEEALSSEGEEEPGEGPREAVEGNPEDILFDDMETVGEKAGDFGVDLPNFTEDADGEEDLLEALEDFDPEEVHDSPRGGDGLDTSAELDELGLDLDLETDLELVEEVDDLVAPSEKKDGGPGEEDTLELVLEEMDSVAESKTDLPGASGEEQAREQGEELPPVEDLVLDAEEPIDDSLFEESESPAESLAAESMEESSSGEDSAFQTGDQVEEEAPASPLLSSPDGEAGAGGEEGAGESGPGVAPWMVPEDVLEETPEGLAAAPSEESLLGGEEGEEELPEIGLRPLEEEEPLLEGEGEGEEEEAFQEDAGPEEQPSLGELYGAQAPAGPGGEGMGEVETSDSLMVEAPKVVGSIYKEEKHGWGVKLILWGSMAASLTVAAFVGWVYVKQKAALSRPGEIWTARVEMPKPALSDEVPPPDLRPMGKTAWKAFQGPAEPPPPPAEVAGPGQVFPTEPVVPPPGKPETGKVAERPGPGEEKPPVKPPVEVPAVPPVASPGEGPAKPSEPVAKPEPAGGGGKIPSQPGETPVAPPVEPPSEQVAQAEPAEPTPVPAEPAEPRAAGKTPASPPPSSGPSPREKGWKDAMGLVRGTQVLAELRNGNYFIGRIYQIGGRKVILDVKKGQLTFYYDEVAHLMPIGPALARKLKEHPTGFVILKNTNRIKGEIVVEAKDYVTIQVREARITIPRESIERVEKGKETSLKLTEDPMLARELGMDDIPAEEEKPKTVAKPAPAMRGEPSIPSGAVEELDRLLGESGRGDKGKEEKVLTLPSSPREGQVKVKAGG